MTRQLRPTSASLAGLTKSPSGVRGLDQITFGGLPRGRPTLVCGGAGTGKTLLGMEFLVRGAQDYNEPGVFVCFEERLKELAENTKSLGFDLNSLIKRKKLVIEHIAIDPSEIHETGDYTLDGLFIRLGAAIDSVGAKRVVIDTIEVLFSALRNGDILRSELQRLFAWLKDKGVTTIVTGERGEGSLTRNGLEEYVSDCVILLDLRVRDQIATRRLRIVKYRGSLHGTNEYPFIIDSQGFLVLPITNVTLDYTAPKDFVSTGVADLDVMLGGKGYYRGGTTLISGAAGTGKSSLSAHFVDAACARGERCVYFAFEESPDQIIRNMRSIGLDLEKWVKSGLLHIAASRPATFGLEVHISMMLKLVDDFKPSVVVLDPISSFDDAGSQLDAHIMLMRIIDQLKSRQITTLLTSLTPGGATGEQTTVGVSSLIDTWVLVRNIEQGGTRTRGLYILKSRGMKHSHEVRELLITDHGLKLENIFLGPSGALVGSARVAQQVRDQAAAVGSIEDIERKTALLAQKRTALKTRIEKLESEFRAEADQVKQAILQEQSQQNAVTASRVTIATRRSTPAKSARCGDHGGARK